MILEYKGFNNNWCYVEAQTITWAMVHVAEVIKKVKSNALPEKDELLKAREMMEAVNTHIRKEVACGGEIIYVLGELPFDEMTNVCVVCLNDINHCTTYVFNKGVYLLNSSGRTVQKLA